MYIEYSKIRYSIVEYSKIKFSVRYKSIVKYYIKVEWNTEEYSRRVSEDLGLDPTVG